MAVFYNAAGVVGLKIWKFLSVAAIIVFLVIGLAETNVSCLVQLYTLAMAVVVSAPFVQFRPQVYTYVLFALTLALLAADNYRSSGPLWLMVPVMMLWSNLHGGFIIGLITMMTYAVAVGLLNFFNGRSLQRACKLGAITIAAIGATLLPPCGLNSWHAVLTAIRNPMTLRIIVDWQPLGTAMMTQWNYSHYGIITYLCLLTFWVGLALSLVVRPHGGDFPLVLIALVMSLAAVKSVRNVPLGAIACVMPAARHLGLLLPDWMQASAADPIPAWPVQWLIAGASLLLTSREVISPQLPTDMAYPSGAVSFMQQRQLHGNVLADFDWGEYLIWHLGSDSKVFVDGRYDTVYPPRVIKDYLAFYYWVLPGADKVPKSYAQDFILIPPDAKAYGKMIRIPGWKLIYRDGESALFARADSRAAQLPGIPVRGSAPSVQYFP